MMMKSPVILKAHLVKLIWWARFDKILEKNINIKDLDIYHKLLLKLACEKAKLELSNNESTSNII